MAEDLTLRCRDGSKRYEGGKVMKYTEEGNPDNEKEEDAGAINIAHGWIQQAQKEKVRHKIIVV